MKGSVICLRKQWEDGYETIEMVVVIRSPIIPYLEKPRYNAPWMGEDLKKEIEAKNKEVATNNKKRRALYEKNFEEYNNLKLGSVRITQDQEEDEK